MSKQRAHYYSSPASRKEVLAALKDAGSWTAREMFAWGTRNGGSDAVFAALAWWVRKGKVSYQPNLWKFVG